MRDTKLSFRLSRQRQCSQQSRSRISNNKDRRALTGKGQQIMTINLFMLSVLIDPHAPSNSALQTERKGWAASRQGVSNPRHQNLKPLQTKPSLPSDPPSSIRAINNLIPQVALPSTTSPRRRESSTANPRRWSRNALSRRLLEALPAHHVDFIW